MPQPTAPASAAFEVAYAKIFGGSPRDAQHRQDCVALWQSAQSTPRQPAYLVIMEGGPDDKVILHVHDALETAEVDVATAGDDLYVGPVVEVPAELVAHGDKLYEFIENVINAHCELIRTVIDKA